MNERRRGVGSRIVRIKKKNEVPRREALQENARLDGRRKPNALKVSPSAEEKIERA